MLVTYGLYVTIRFYQSIYDYPFLIDTSRNDGAGHEFSDWRGGRIGNVTVGIIEFIYINVEKTRPQ